MLAYDITQPRVRDSDTHKQSAYGMPLVTRRAATRRLIFACFGIIIIYALASATRCSSPRHYDISRTALSAPQGHYAQFNISPHLIIRNLLMS